jgi:hypothetical protein
MQIHHYDGYSKEYFCSSEVETLPEILTSMTPIEPPEVGENEARVFNEAAQKWDVKPDFRGTTRYTTTTGAPVYIRGIGALEDVALGTTGQARPSSNHVWENDAWVLPEPDPVPAPAPRPIARVTMRQARLALLGAGMLEAVNTALAGMSGIAGEAARIEWEYATTVDKNSPLIAGLSDALGLTEAQLDELFGAASQL